MKYLIFSVLLALSFNGYSQNLQLHYNFARSIDPRHNTQNFPIVYFEYFKAMDTTSSLLKPGAFLFKIETDLQADRNDIGKAFIQASQTFRCWEPKIFIGVQYSGGLGVTNPAQYSYYINNCYSIGPSYPFQWKGAYFNAEFFYNYNALKRPSHDLMLSFYWGKGFWNYRMEFDGDFELYTLNRNNGDVVSTGLTGKMICFFGEPQVWFKIKGDLALGSKAFLYYHVINTENLFQVYPTIAVRIKF